MNHLPSATYRPHLVLLLVAAMLSACGGGGSSGGSAAAPATGNTTDTGTTNSNPTPAVAALTPNNVTSGASSLTVTVTGSGFVSGSTVTWNGTALSTTYVAPTQLSATVPATAIAAPQAVGVTVTNPAPGGGTSSAQTFTVVPANPTLATGVQAEAWPYTALVSFTQPTAPDGKTIVSYTAKDSTGYITGTSPVSPVLVAGSYPGWGGPQQFTVVANYSDGTHSDDSTASNAVQPTGGTGASTSANVYMNGVFDWMGDDDYSGSSEYADTTGAPTSDPYGASPHDLYFVNQQGQQGGWQPYAPTNAFDVSPYQYLELDLKPTAGGETWNVYFTAKAGAAAVNTTVVLPGTYGPTPVAGQWAHYKIPFTALNIGGTTGNNSVLSFAVQGLMVGQSWYANNVQFTGSSGTGTGSGGTGGGGAGGGGTGGGGTGGGGTGGGGTGGGGSGGGGTGGGTGGGGSGTAPTFTQLLLQGQDAQSQSHNAVPTQPNHLTVGWKSVSGATSYNIYRSVNQGNYTLLTNVPAAAATAAYLGYVAHSGGFPYQTGVDSAYQDTAATGATGYPAGSGPDYYLGTGYTYKVSAITSSGESAQSTDSIAIYFVNGIRMMCQDTFDGTLSYADTGGGTTPLGFPTSTKWSVSSGHTIANPFVGYGAVDQNLNIRGFNYLIMNIKPGQNGSTFAFSPARVGDQPLLNGQLHSQSYGTLVAGQWTTLKIPLSDLMVDQVSGSNAQQHAFYKVTLASDLASGGSETYWMEWYFSKN